MADAPMCKPCDKRIFLDETTAQRAALRQSSRHGKAFTVYPCRVDIRRFHLTTSRDYESAPAVGSAPVALTTPGTVAAGFLAEPPLARARRYAQLEMKGGAAGPEVAWLHANALWWLRALLGLRTETHSHIAKGKRSIAHLKPAGGINPSPQYLAALADHEKRTVQRLHFIERVTQRIADVKSLLGAEPVDGWQTAGDLAETFVRIADHVAAGEHADARQVALSQAERWSRRAAA